MFCLPPPVAGPWHHVDGLLRAQLLARLAECRFSDLLLSGGAIMRVMPLSFWDGWFLCDIEPLAALPAPEPVAWQNTEKPGGKSKKRSKGRGAPGETTSEAAPPRIHSFVYGPDGFLPLDGSSPRIHQHNEIHGINIAQRENQYDYLRFFCFFVRGDEGAFEVIERPEQVNRSTDPEIRAKIKPPEALASAERKRKDDAFMYSATILYGGSLFDAEFALQRGGMIEMLTDDLIAESVQTEPDLQFAGTARWLNPSPKAMP